MKTISFIWALLLLSLVAHAATNVSSCMVISAPGEYILNQSLTGAPTPTVWVGATVCINVNNTADVILDCNGFSITGSGNASQSAILTYSGTNTTIKNCVISNYGSGINHASASTSDINNTISNTTTGINTFYQNTTPHLFINNTITSTDTAIRCNRAYCIATNNTFHGATYGFASSTDTIPSITILNNNTAYDNTYNFYLTAHSNVTSDGNTARDGTYGFFVYNSNFTSTNDHSYDNVNGVYEQGESLLSMSNAHIYTNSYSFVSDYNAAPPQVLLSNVEFGSSSVNLSLSDSTDTDYKINETTDPSGASFPLGYFSFEDKYLLVNGTDSLDDLTFHWSDDESATYDESTLTVFAWDGSEWSEVPSVLDTDLNTLSLSDYSPSLPTVLGLFATVSNNVSSCMAINSPGFYTLNTSLTGASIPIPDSPTFACIIINASGVSLDCAGYSLTGEGSNVSIITYTSSDPLTDIEISNCIVSNYSGAFIASNSSTIFTNDTAYDNTVGFTSMNSNVTFSSNNAHDNSGGYSISYSIANLTNNLGQDNTNTNFLLLSSNATLVGNNASNGAISFALNNSNATLTGNRVVGSVYGFYFSISNLTLEDNIVNTTHTAFASLNSSAYFLNNYAYGTSGEASSGFFSYMSNSTLINNTATDGNFTAFYSISSNVTYTNNTADNFTIFGFYSYNSITDFFANTITTVPIGFATQLSNSTFDRNIADDILVFGFYAMQSPNVTFANNLVSNAYGGFFSLNSSVVLSNNTVNSSDYGFVYRYSNVSSSFDQVYDTGLGINVSYSSANISHAWTYDNSWEFATEGDGTEWPLYIENSKFGASSVNLSLNDSYNSSYLLNDTISPGSNPSGYSSFEDKYLLVNGAEQLNNLTFHWSNDEETGHDISSLTVFEWNGSAWTEVSNQILDTDARTLTVYGYVPTSDTILGLFIYNESEEEHEPDEVSDSDDSNPSLFLDVDVDAMMVTVTSRGDPVEDAKIFVEGNLVGYTNEDGELEIDVCGDDIYIKATKSGYDYDDATVDFDSCYESGCSSNSDCTSDEICSDNSCEQIDCECGAIDNHECISYECCSSSDCNTNEDCVGNVCEPISVPECYSDTDCYSSEYCDNGACAEIIGTCGYISNHAFVEYECGDEEGCPSCQTGLCLAHTCVSYELSCLDGVIGSTSSCHATVGDDSCNNCEYSATDPNGKTITGTTDANGDIELPLGVVGTYHISIIRNGDTVTTAKIEATQLLEEGSPKATSLLGEGFSFFFVILLLLLLAIALYIYSRRKKKQNKYS